MNPKVTLVSSTQYPVETIYHLWEASRTNIPMPSVGEIAARMESDAEFKARVRETFEKVVDSAIPVAENINFVFLLENVSVSFREQMVRHRIGVKVGERMGVDFFPDLSSSTWWSQSMRVLDMSKFADNGEYRLPPSVEEKGGTIAAAFKHQMKLAQDSYAQMVKSGIPAEDAREVLPLGTLHRISWGLNLAALTHILKKRGCWILQLGLWEPVIRGIVKELATKVDPYFWTLVQPPCVKGDKYVGCNVKLDNEKRMKREDPLPPCSLFLHKEKLSAVGAEGEEIERMVGADRMPKFKQMEEGYSDLWNRDVHTGVRRG